MQARTFVAAFEVLTPSPRTADIHAGLCDRLAARAIFLSDPAGWIAAHALEHRLPLLSTDRSFRHVPGLKLHLLHPRFIRASRA